MNHLSDIFYIAGAIFLLLYFSYKGVRWMVRKGKTEKAG